MEAMKEGKWGGGGGGLLLQALTLRLTHGAEAIPGVHLQLLDLCYLHSGLKGLRVFLGCQFD
jgi:hypothetical protein